MMKKETRKVMENRLLGRHEFIPDVLFSFAKAYSSWAQDKSWAYFIGGCGKARENKDTLLITKMPYRGANQSLHILWILMLSNINDMMNEFGGGGRWAQKPISGLELFSNCNSQRT